MDRRKFIINSAETAAGLVFVSKSANAISIQSVSDNNGEALVNGDNLTLNPVDNGKGLVNTCV